MPEIKEIELRSNEVQEILTKVPHWTLRWGNVLISALLCMIFLLSWVIKYPDVVSADITITTQIPPEKLIAKSSGRLEKILINNKEIIPMNTALAVIENTAYYKDVFKLKQCLDTLRIQNNFFSFPFEKLQDLHLGDIENAFAIFEKDYLAYKFNRELHPYKVEGKAQGYEVIELTERLSLLMQQKEITYEEIQLKKRELERYKKLYDKGVIATQEWDTKNLDYMQVEKNLRSLNSSISQTKSLINDLDKNSETTKINETKDDISLFRNALQSLSQLKKAVHDWELNYVIRSSISGEVSYLGVWTESQTINTGDNVFTIIPTHTQNYIGKMKAVAQNSGKIRIGQKVNIRLANYPDYEYGLIEGEITYISLTPDNEGNFLIDVMLPKHLITSYNKKIEFQQEMTGTADIITADLRLCEKLLYQFREIFNRKKIKENLGEDNSH